MVGAAALLVDPPAADALLENAVRHVQGQDLGHLLTFGAEELVERARASHCLAPERRALCGLVEREIVMRRIGANIFTLGESWDPARPLRRCNRAGCGRREATDAEFRQCARCNSIVYCGRECQKLDWPRHKPVCVGRGLADAG